MENTNSWYIKSDKDIRGPFPSGQISQMVLLGRITLDTQVSHDKQTWQKIGLIDTLIPDVYKSDQDENSKERIAAARRWADERREERRNKTKDERRAEIGRRINETPEEREHREKRELTYKIVARKKRVPVLPVSVFFIVAASAVYFAFLSGSDETATQVDCQSAIGQGMNWNNCSKPGLIALKQDLSKSSLASADLSAAKLVGSNFSKSNLSYANLSRANLSFTNLQGAMLKGANLQAADLSQANLSGANLQYANLQNSKLTGADLDRADLSFAIWVDGKKCQAGSVSVCK